MTLVEAAALLRIDSITVERLAREQQLPARQLGSEWRFSRSALLQWLAGDGQFRTARSTPLRESDAVAAPTSATVLAQAESSFVTGRGTSGATATNAQNPAQPIEPIGAAPDQPTATDVFLRDQRILLAPQQFTLDVGVFYSRREAPALVQLNGVPTLANAEVDVFTTLLIGRYSLARNTELFASASYGHQQAYLYSGAQRLSEATRSEFGDIGLGVRRTVIEEGPGRPDVIVSLDARIPTGQTSPALGAGVTLVKSLDPVVLFGTLGYRHTRSRDFADITRLEPRNRFDLTLGYAFALNDTLSINTAILNSFQRATTFSNASLRSTNTSSLQLGMTARVAKGVYLQPSVSYRLDGSTRGYTAGLNVPITF